MHWRRIELPCRCLRTWWQNCLHVRRFSFSACRGELPFDCAAIIRHLPPLSDSVSLYVGDIIGLYWRCTLQALHLRTTSLVLCFYRPSAGVCCRSFRRAAAASDRLEDDIVDQLLVVLSTGALLFLVDPLVQPFSPRMEFCQQSLCPDSDALPAVKITLYLHIWTLDMHAYP